MILRIDPTQISQQHTQNCVAYCAMYCTQFYAFTLPVIPDLSCVAGGDDVTHAVPVTCCFRTQSHYISYLGGGSTCIAATTFAGLFLNNIISTLVNDSIYEI